MLDSTNMEKIKEFFENLGKHDLPTGVAVLVGIILLFLMFKTGKFLAKILMFLVALGLFAGAYWWHVHK